MSEVNLVTPRPAAPGPTVSFATLGCKTNQFESAAMREVLERAGYRVVPFAAGAELVVTSSAALTPLFPAPVMCSSFTAPAPPSK